MANASEAIRVNRLLDMYRANPMLFNEEQLDELQELAKQTDLTFNRVSTDFNLRNIVETAIGGVFEGFTTIPIGRTPRNTYEAIAHSMGHLIGFAPGITAIPLKGLAAGASRLGMKGVKRGLEKGAFGAQVANKFSVPMFFGDKASDLVNKGIAKAGIESMEFMKLGSAARGIIGDAVHLGVASGVSSIWGGPDQILNSMVHGSIAGGAFGGLGNFKRIGNLLKSKNVANHKEAERIIKAGIGSMMLGLPTTLREMPIEMQLYQYLLGGFFGYQTRPSYEKAGMKFYAEDMISGRPDRVFYPEKNPEWDTLSKETKNYVYKQASDQARISMMKTGAWKTEKELEKHLVDAAEKRVGRTPTEEDVNNMAREQAGRIVQGGVIINLEQWEDPFPEELGDPRKTPRPQMLVQLFRKDGKPNESILSVEAIPRGGDYHGTKMDENSPVSKDGKSWSIPAETLDGREIITLKYINTNAVKDAEGNIIAVKPFKGVPDFENGTVKYIVKQKDWFAIEDHLASQNLYIDGGVKDKGNLKVSSFHPDINQIDIETMIKHLARGQLNETVANNPDLTAGQQKRLLNQYRSEITENYENSLNKEIEWFGDAIESEGMGQNVVKRHEDSWKSNVLWEAQRYGLYTVGQEPGVGFSRIGNLMNSKVGASNVVDRNKREQVFHTKSVPLDIEINGKNYFNITILEDYVPNEKEYPDFWYKTDITNPDGTVTTKKLHYGSETDGTIYIRKDVWDSIVKDSGFQKEDKFINDLMKDSGMLKPFIVSKTDTGVMIGKAAGRRASKSMSEFMAENELDMIVMRSAAKYSGGIRPSRYDYIDGKHIALDELDIRKMPISDMRLDLGVYENPYKSTSPQMIVRQLFGNLNEDQHKKVSDHVFKTIYEPLIDGDPKQNTLIESYIKDPRIDIDLNQIDIDKISLKNIHAILSSEGKELKDLRTQIRDHIMRISTEREEGEADLNFTDEQWRDYLYRNKRVFHVVGTTDAVADGFKATNKFWEHTYKRYIINRYLRPKWQFSGKGWAAPYDAELIKEQHIKSGEFMLDNGMKRLPVDFDVKIINKVYPKREGDVSTLGDIHRLSQDIKRPDFSNRLKEKGLYKEVKKALDNFDSEFVIIRVPADSSSGARVLRFKGFTGRKGTAIVTHPRDDAYLGGMDKDSDSMFIYHGFDKKIKDAYKSVDAEWEKDGKVIEGKSTELDHVFNDITDEGPYLHQASIFSPSMRKEVARNVYQGNLGIGWAINNRMTVQAWIDMALANEGKLEVDVHPSLKSRSGDETFRLNYKSDFGQYILTLKPNAGENVRRYAREMLNRSADAGNYPKMRSYVRFPQLLFEQAFNIEYKPAKWMKPDDIKKYDYFASANFQTVKNNTDLGKIHKIIQTMKPNAITKVTELLKRKGKVVMKDGKPVRIKKTGAMMLDEFQIRIGGDTEVSPNFKYKLPNILSYIGTKARNDGVNEMLFAHPYESNINLVKTLKSVLAKDPLARELDIIVNLADNLETIRMQAAVSGQRGDWKQLAEMLRKENFLIASFMTLTRKAHAIEKKVMDEGGTREDVIRNLKRIPERASEIKNKFKNVDRTPESELKNAYFNDFDSELVALKNVMRQELGEQGIDPTPFEEYLDIYMLSPLVKGNKYGMTSRIPWQSPHVGNKAIKEVFDELDIVVKLAKEPAVKQIDKLEGFTEYLHRPSGYAKIDDSFTKFMGEEFVSDPQFDKNVKKLKDYMVEHPYWAEHPQDAFIMYTYEFEGSPRSFSTMTKDDVSNLLRFFEYYDPKFKQGWIDKFIKNKFPDTKDRDPMRIQRIFYYNRPATLDKKTLAHEIRIFEQANMPVREKDRVVIKNVKRIMSTHGAMREWLSKMVSQSENEVSTVLDSMDETTFRSLAGITPNQRIELFNKAVDIIEGKIKLEDIPKEYLEKKIPIEEKVLIDGKEKVVIKEFTGEQMLSSLTNRIRNDLEEFGNEYIYLSDNWKQVEKDINTASIVKLNEYMRWKNRKFDFDNFYRKVIEPAWKGKDITNIPLEAIYRAQYEYRLEQIIANNKINNPSKFRKLYREGKARKDKSGNFYDTTFKPIGKRNKETYFPHIWRDPLTKAEQREVTRFWNDIIEEELSKSLSNPKNTVEYLREQSKLMNKESAKKLNKLLDTYDKTKDIDILQSIMEPAISAKYQYAKDGLSHPTKYGEAHMYEALVQVDMTSKDIAAIISDLVRVGFFSRPKNILERQVEKPAYMREYDALKRYKEGIIKSRLKNLAALMGDVEIDNMTAKKPFGKYTNDHAEFYRMYLRDSLGYKTTFSDWVLKAMESSDPLRLKKNLYYQTSDHEMIQKLDRILKFFGVDKLPFKVPQNDQARAEYLARIIHKLGSVEAKYQLLTLLANTGVATGNLFGGSLNTITKTGLRNFLRSTNFKYLEKNILKDENGKYQLTFKNGKYVKTKKDLKRWIIEKGVIEQYIKNELDFNPKVQAMKNKKALYEFAKDFSKLLSKNPDPNKETILEIARRHGLTEKILEIGAFPMQASERWLRANAFLSHLLQIRDSFNGMTGELDLNSDAIIRYALNGVEATQFVYHSVGRSGFMRTATGKVLTRFKNFVQNQIAFQREVHRQARMYGYKPGTKPYEDFQRLFMINAMLMALGAAYSYSLFDVATPPPLDWMRETAELLWGDKKERERAFFGTYPRAVAPLQILTPPIARIPQSLVMLLNGDWERFADYQAWTLFPFGRLARSVDKTFNEPYGTTFGRGMQQFFRIPTDKFRRRYDRAQIKDMRKEYITSSIDDLTESQGEEWDNKEN